MSAVAHLNSCHETMSGDAVIEGEPDGGTARGDTQLVIDSVEVGVDRVRTEVERLGDLRVRETCCHQPQDLALTFAKPGGSDSRSAPILAAIPDASATASSSERGKPVAHASSKASVSRLARMAANSCS